MSRKIFVTVALVLSLFALFTISLLMGSMNIRIGEVFGALFGSSAEYSLIVNEIRLPRTLAAILVGGGLALAGAAIQGLFRNPLAEPGIIGASSGGALGAVLCLHLGVASLHFLLLPCMAFAGALLATLTVYLIAVKKGRVPIVSILLAGIAISSLTGACTSFILSTSNAYALREMLFWLMGGLEARSWAHIHIAAPFIILASLILIGFSRQLDVMTQGESVAESLGVPVARARILVILFVSMITGAAVAISGIIGFVGIIVPHIVRILIGPRHVMLLICSFIGGASLLLLADILSRAFSQTEIRIGIITAFLGVPFFIYLLKTSEGKENFA